MLDASTPSANVAEIYVVEYENDVDDILAMNAHYAGSSKHLKKASRGTGISTLLTVAIVASVVFLADPASWRDNLPLVAIWSVLYAALILILRFRAKKAANQLRRNLVVEHVNRALLARRRVTITPEDLCMESGLSSGRTKWAGIDRVNSGADHLFINDSLFCVNVIPRRAFKDNVAFREFCDAAERFHRAASPGSCRKCGYDLVGNTSGKCPECGTPIA